MDKRTIYSLLVLPFLCLLSCLSKYEAAVFTVTSFDLSNATTETNNGKPLACSDTANKNLFALELNFGIDDNLDEIDYYPTESYSYTDNPIDSVAVWSNTTFCGIPAGNLINSKFYVLPEEYATTYRLNDNSGLSLSISSKQIPYYTRVHFVCDGAIQTGDYKFFTQLFFKDGSTMIDSTAQIYLK